MTSEAERLSGAWKVRFESAGRDTNSICISNDLCCRSNGPAWCFETLAVSLRIMPGDSSTSKEKSRERVKDVKDASFSGEASSKHPKEPNCAPTSTPAPADESFPASSSPSSSTLTTAAVMEYLRCRGFERSEAVLKAELEALASGKSAEAALSAAIATGGPSTARTITLDELAAKSAPRDLASASGEKIGSGPGPLELLAAEALKVDKTDRIRGFGMVRNWCEGGLDVYQVCTATSPTRENKTSSLRTPQSCNDRSQ